MNQPNRICAILLLPFCILIGIAVAAAMIVAEHCQILAENWEEMPWL